MSMQRIKRLRLRLASTMRSQGGLRGIGRKVKSTLQDEGLGGVARKATSLLRRTLVPHSIEPVSPHYYAEWRKAYDTLSEEDLALMREHIGSLNLPELQLVLRLSGMDSGRQQAVLQSLRAQIYENWRAIVLVDEAAPLDASTSQDKRITFAEGDATNLLEATPSAAHVVLMDGETVLREHALYMFALEAARGIGLAYADSDRLLDDGNYVEPFFKPDYSPELLRRLNYVGGCALFSTQPLLGGGQLAAFAAGRMTVCDVFRAQAEELDAGQVSHVPFVLFHETADTRDPDLTLPPPWLPEGDLPTVSIIIPTRDGLDFLEPCLASIRDISDYPKEKVEIVVVDNGSTDPQILQYMGDLAEQGKIELIKDPRPFNYSSLNNVAARAARGEVLVFLNNDVVIDDAKWLRRLVAYAMQPDVGAVGGKLLYPDRTIQHGGIVLGIQGVVAHAHHNLREHDYGHHYLNVLTREMSAVTGACLAIRKAVFDEIGGFDENLKVAFNDVVLCLDAVARGYRNIYVADPLLIHFESKTRGFDDTTEKVDAFRAEARYARLKHPALMARDPRYSPNLGLEHVYGIAYPPRVFKPWQAFRREQSGRLRILMLSVTHQIGHGVPVVVNEQALYLAALGHKVYVAGPQGKNEFAYGGCERVYLSEPQEAAIFAVQHQIDCVVAHTPPYFSVFRWLGDAYSTLVYDYGEPNPDFFPDSAPRRAILSEKRLCLAMAERLYAISRSVRDEADEPRMQVIRIANSHLTVWNADHAQRRLAVRKELGWEGKLVVVNVCRFHKSERYYKGINAYVQLLDDFRSRYPELSSRMVFALCGKGTDEDVAEMQAHGLAVFANVPDERLIDMYCGADIYVNLSQWEGYNLGIGQALAMGLPVIASDIPAHREFGVFVSNDNAALSGELKRLSDAFGEAEPGGERQATVWEWSESLDKFAAAIDEAVTTRRALT